MQTEKDNSPRGSSKESQESVDAPEVKKSREDIEDRKFIAIVYPDAENYSFLDVLKNAECVYQWAYILHDRDVDDDGCQKKPHYHVLLRYCNPRKLSTVANQLGIPSNDVQNVRSFKASERYLIHRTPDSFDKFQYPVKDVFTNISKFSYDVGELNECTALQEIYNLLDSGKYTLPQLARYLATEYANPDIYSAFRRNFSILKFVDDDNKRFEKERAWKEVEYSPTVTVDMRVVDEILKGR